MSSPLIADTQNILTTHEQDLAIRSKGSLDTESIAINAGSMKKKKQEQTIRVLQLNANRSSDKASEDASPKEEADVNTPNLHEEEALSA